MDDAQTDDLAETILELTDPIIEYSWEDADVLIPQEEVRGVAWRIDRVCLFPDRHLVALIRRKRVLPYEGPSRLPQLRRAQAGERDGVRTSRTARWWPMGDIYARPGRR